MAYDPRAIKLPKEIKRVAATIDNKELRDTYIRYHVKLEEEVQLRRSSRNRGKKEEQA